MKNVAICCGIINSSDYIQAYLQQLSKLTDFQALFYYQYFLLQLEQLENQTAKKLLFINDENDEILVYLPKCITIPWLFQNRKYFMKHSSLESSMENIFFKDFIQQFSNMKQTHISKLADVICHEFLMVCVFYAIFLFILNIFCI